MSHFKFILIFFYSLLWCLTSNSIANAHQKCFNVIASAYNATTSQCDKTPHLTAFGKIPHHKNIIAVSKDLEKKGLKRGSIVLIKGLGCKVVYDRMSLHKRNSIDILFASKKDAINFGKKNIVIYLISNGDKDI